MADLYIDVDVVQLENGDFQTVSSYRIPTRGKVVFTNVATDHGKLVISPKPPATTLPFCKGDGTPKNMQPIEPGKRGGARVCKEFEGAEFLYTAKVGDTIAEDPIVIIERKLNFVFEPASFALGAGVAVVLAYVAAKLWANKARPQQG
jgi:hypothetical protein